MAVVFQLWYPNETTQTIGWNPSSEPVYPGTARPLRSNAIVHELPDGSLTVYGRGLPYKAHAVEFHQLSVADVLNFEAFWSTARLSSFKLKSQVTEALVGAGLYVLVRPESWMLNGAIQWQSEGRSEFGARMEFREVNS